MLITKPREENAVGTRCSETGRRGKARHAGRATLLRSVAKTHSPTRSLAHSLVNRTLDPADLEREPVRAVARRLRGMVRRWFLTGRPLAVNGVLRRRWHVRFHKMWEYARGLVLAYIAPGMRVLDYGGGATLPVFYLAEQGHEVLSLDIDRKLTDYTNDVARRRGWNLEGSTWDVSLEDAPAEWGRFDRILSFSVLEHVPAKRQAAALERLADLLVPGGIMAITFDYGEQAPHEDAMRTPDDVEQIVKASGLRPLGNQRFHDTGARFRLDKRHAECRFTFGSVFLRKR